MASSKHDPDPRTPVDSDLILNSAVARAITVIGDRWVGLILRDAFLGIRRFEEFRARSGAARGTLTSRLKALVEHGVLRQVVYQKSPRRFEYRLTPMGIDLYAFILAVWDWETRWSEERDIPQKLVHTGCGKLMRPEIHCQACDAPVRMREVRFEAREPSAEAGNIPARFQRRSTGTRAQSADVDHRFFHVLDVIGDRWTGLVLAATFFGLSRYDEIARAIGISTNILSNRLKLLVDAEVLSREPYQKRPLRHRYRLTSKGADLYLTTLEMHAWAERWLMAPDERPLVLRHLPCGHLLETRTVCSACGDPLDVHNVTFERDADD
ncbi:winged helix-turn-helix transcriptional regulator [Elongatibacter sediminis]|uniref:Helix-turn-helix domain-containing protein n=1 Tax=Elongatibacter sediminis TaxID=3119006 RepID=A0AAW9RII1_9GAMM